MRMEPSAPPHDQATAAGRPWPPQLRRLPPTSIACDSSGPRPAAFPVPSLMAGALALLLSANGCQATMPSQDQSASDPRPTTGEIVPNEFPMRFEVHRFGAHCYNTIGCTVFYNHQYQVRDAADQKRAAPSGPNYMSGWGPLEIGIESFPGPAQVQWRSLDETQHEAEIDFDSIFKNRLVLHEVPEAEITEGWVGTHRPEIHLEINDRTINVYMRTNISTKGSQDPGNRYSNFRIETTKAWSKTF